MPSDKLGFGIVGCGLVSQFHGQAIAAAGDAQLMAATDLLPERAAEFCGKFGGDAMESFEAMLARDDIDVVNVLTPNAAHEEYVVPAFDAGKHVIVEKPPEMTLEKADNMIAASERAGKKLAVCLQVRFRKAIEAIKSAIDAGRFGRLLHGDTYMKWFRTTDYYMSDDWRQRRDEGAGVTIQHAFHYIDLLHHLMGPVSSLRAHMSNLVHPEVDLEDTLLALLQYENGAQGVVQASTALYPGTDIRIEINGENGTAIMQGERITTWDFTDEQPQDDEVRSIGSEQVKTAAGGAADFAFFEHQWLIEDMIRAIRTDGQPRVTCPSARGTLEIALAMYKSADEDAEVRLPLG
ncbi:MAG: Gfo/Idh/MocA family protein [Armatimonadota bacterium]